MLSSETSTRHRLDTRKRVLIADGQPLFVAALKQLIQRLVGAVDMLEARTLADLERILDNSNPAHYDLLILDLSVADGFGLTSLINLCGRYPSLRVLATSSSNAPDLAMQALAHGAMAYLPKSALPAQFELAISRVLSGHCWVHGELLGVPLFCALDKGADFASRLRRLTPKQYRIMLMMSTGLLNKQIAANMGVAETTIKAHVCAIMKQLQLRNRTQVALAVSELKNSASLLMADSQAA